MFDEQHQQNITITKKKLQTIITQNVQEYRNDSRVFSTLYLCKLLITVSSLLFFLSSASYKIKYYVNFLNIDVYYNAVLYRWQGKTGKNALVMEEIRGIDFCTQINSSSKNQQTICNESEFTGNKLTNFLSRITFKCEYFRLDIIIWLFF